LCDLQRQLTAIMGGTTLRQIVETERGLAV
jgi:hypothetical protein